MRTPDPRTVISVLLLAAGAALSSLLGIFRDDDAPAEQPPELQLAYYLDTAELTGTAADGTILYTVRTRSARQNSDSDSIELADILMDYGAPGGLPWQVRADRGHIPAGARVIELQGNVVAVSGAEAPQQAIINTESLAIEPATMQASTEKYVRLTFNDRHLNATGLQADFAANNLKLLSNVNGKFIP